jgi:hypothetical protein
MIDRIHTTRNCPARFFFAPRTLPHVTTAALHAVTAEVTVGAVS